jgi:chromosome condensin MukBEF MukE localization factor
VFKNEFFGKVFSEQKLQFASEVLCRFDEKKNLTQVNSSKVREMELENLLHKILEKNRLRHNNNKFVTDTQQNSNQELYDNMLVSVMKQHLLQCMVNQREMISLPERL